MLNSSHDLGSEIVARLAQIADKSTNNHIKRDLIALAADTEAYLANKDMIGNARCPFSKLKSLGSPR